MINNKKLTAIIPVRAGSQRVINKNIKKFAGTNLIEIKINTLKKVNEIDEIIISSDSDEMLEIGKKNNIKTHKREKYFASSKATNSEFFYNLATISNSEYVLYSPVTSPLISEETIKECIYSIEKGNSSNIVTTTLIKHHLWLNGKPLNYKISESPNSQDLPDIHSINYACCIIKKLDMLEFKNVVTNNPTFYVTNEIESIDIDTEFDFSIAEFFYKKINNII